ncbi:MAG: undecaprenyl-phosphate glucose phosphotransferase [Spirochaetales bacterium]|nr:undecaprenyl-phosphate glucose phosphotransferase [Spirochaetales bacterium]
MLKKHARDFAIVQRIFDLLAVLIAWMLAYFIRFVLMPGGEKGLFLNFMGLVPHLLIISLFFNTRNNLYQSTRYYSWYKEVARVVKSNVQSITTFFIVLYMITQVRFSRYTLIFYAFLVIIISVIFRLMIRNQLLKLRKSGKNLRYIVLAGASKRIEDYIKTLQMLPQTGIRVIGWIDSDGLNEKYNVPEMEFTDFDNPEKDPPDMVMIGYAAKKYKKINMAIETLNLKFIQSMLIPDIQHDYLGFDIEEFEGIPMMAINAPHLSMVDNFVKRGIDIIGALVGILLLSPFYLIIGFLVKITSRGPMFYGQKRMSLDGETFKMWKFRSMRTDSEDKTGAVWATKNDDRTTKIGKILRKTSLDEIPQFWNVLMGDMSLVGPRPERPVFIDEFKHEIPSYMLRHRVKAGITGWAQVNGWRGNTSIEKRIEFDIYYINHWSIPFDIMILLLTFVKGFINRNAY